MNAPPFPIAPEVGQTFQNWVWNGVRWVATPTTGMRQNVVSFTQSGPYMPSPGLVSLTVECWGAGGGGGTAASAAPGTSLGGGGGGGSGGYSRKTLPAALVRGGVLVTVGVGGQGVTDNLTTGASFAGGATSFGAFCLANGGGGGQANTSTSYWGEPGSGAAPGIGDIAVWGNPGLPGASQAAASDQINVQNGIGGSILGGSGIAILIPAGTSAAGNDGGMGAGGSGGSVNVPGTEVPGVPGGKGGDGLCVVTETLWGDRDQPDIGWRPPLDVNVSFPKPPWPGGGPWPPGAWWPPGWGPPGWGPGRPWPPGSGPGPRGAIEGREFEAGQPYDQSVNPETGRPWEDDG